MKKTRFAKRFCKGTLISKPERLEVQVMTTGPCRNDGLILLIDYNQQELLKTQSIFVRAQIPLNFMAERAVFIRKLF